MRMPEMPLEPRDGRLIIGATDEAPEDEDRIMELMAWVHRRVDNG